MHCVGTGNRSSRELTSGTLSCTIAGTPAAPSLADAEWLNISGSYDEIVQTIHTGVPKPKAHPGSMPPLGGGSFTDDQVRQLAAYVFALSHQGS